MKVTSHLVARAFVKQASRITVKTAARRWLSDGELVKLCRKCAPRKKKK